MGELLYDLLYRSARARPDDAALLFRGNAKSYADLAHDVKIVARGLLDLGVGRHDRVAVYLDKQFETVDSILGAAAAGAVFVPINPALKALQVVYILNDCNVRVLVTTKTRLSSLAAILPSCPDLRWIIMIGDTPVERHFGGIAIETWGDLFDRGRTKSHPPHSVVDTDMVGILYTSGSTGNPKGVVLSHRNVVLGAVSVAQYLRYQATDRILNLPPYSFDFGLNQLFSSLHAGTTAVLHNYLTPQDLLKTICAERVTGVSGVPTVMIQLAALNWPAEAVDIIRYMSTTGGRMPEPAVRALRNALPKTDIYLMYGLTESFRSTYLPPDEVDRRPNSIGRPIPNAEVLVVRSDGTLCDAGEPGELVHKGALVSLGYWNDPIRTAERFRPAPGQSLDQLNPELAVWSGDTVMRDKDGFIYFVGRKDEMIKTSGYRVSPTEVEEAVFASGCVGVAAAVGVDHPELGQAIVVFATAKDGRQLKSEAILTHCRKQLPAYMVPQRIIRHEVLPLNANGKIDRKKLAADYTAGEQIEFPQDDIRQEGVRSTMREGRSNFVSRWMTEARQLIGIEKRPFKSISEIFVFTFPDRPIDSNVTFVSLEGDSLSYVAVSTGIEAFLGFLPDDWEHMPISALERLDHASNDNSALRPDIALRALAILGVIANHAGGGFTVFAGGATLLFALTGFSFARFIWSDSPRRIFMSVTHFVARILVPTLLVLALIFIKRHEISWSVLFFYENLVEPSRVFFWWTPGWWLQVLFQILLLMVAVSAIPGVARFGVNHKYEFGVIFVIAAVALNVGMALTVDADILTLDRLPQYSLWQFAIGWLVYASRTNLQKINAMIMLIAAWCVATVLSRLGLVGDISPTEDWAYWLVGGCVALLWAPAFSVHRSVSVVAATLARSSLFVYLFHYPLALALLSVFQIHDKSLRIGLGFLGSLAIWIVWESTLRTVRRTGRVSPACGETAVV